MRRRTVVELLVLAALVASPIHAWATHEPTGVVAGTVEEPASATTLVATQGFQNELLPTEGKRAQLVALGPRGTVRWSLDRDELGVDRFYGLDPLPGGDVLVTTTVDDETRVFVVDPDTGRHEALASFAMRDTHAVEYRDGELLVANLRNYAPEASENRDRLVAYDLATDEIVWEFRFAEEFDRTGGGDYTGDWTHVNDIDVVGERLYAVSVRNFDTVVLVDRDTGEVVGSLGSDGEHATLYEQHNPDCLGGGRACESFLVADSENDRIVEYARNDDEWERTWKLRGSLSWPRDANRLSNGNTLVVDSLNHRVVEVTPTGEVVWEAYVPWAPYEAVRLPHGENRTAPTAADVGAPERVTLVGSADRDPGDGGRRTVAEWVETLAVGTPVEDEVSRLATRWSHVAPWARPVWMGPWELGHAVGAVVLSVLLTVRAGVRRIRDR